MEGAIGKNNKVVILDYKGDFVIFNEQEGVWENGVWFSNETFKTARKSIASLDDRKIIEKNGKKWLMHKKGDVFIYNVIDTPLLLEDEKKVSDTHEEKNKKIIKFAERQLNKTLAKPKTLLSTSTTPLETIIGMENIDISHMY